MEVFLGLLLFFVTLVGLVCFIINFVVLFQVKGDQQKNSKMLSLLLKELRSSKETTEKPTAGKIVEKPEKTIGEVAAKLKAEREKAPAPALSEANIKTPAKSMPPVTAPEKKPVAASSPAVKKKEVPKPSTPPREPSSFERKAADIMKKIWNWIVVGEEFRNPDVSIEYAIASVWLLRVAIVILVLGGVFFVTYSIEKGWLKPIARVSGMLLGGVVMLGFGMKLANKKYHLIAQGLLGGGIAMLYIGIFAGFSKFKIIDTLPAFALMIIITITAGVIAVRLNSLLVAVFGVLGGYLTPILINTGTGNLPGLFSYLILLGICTLWIAKHRDWKLLNFFAFIFTYGLFFLAIDRHYEDQDFPMAITFLSLFFILFSFIPILYNIINRQKSTVIELIFMLINSSIFAIASFSMITDLYDKQYFAVVTIALTAFYIGQIYFFLYRKIQDRNLLIMLTGFASIFVTLTIPSLLSDEWITTAWAIQALAFMWMSKKMKSNFVRLVSHLLYFLTFGRLLSVDFYHNFVQATTVDYWHEMLNRFMTCGVTIISLVGSYYILKKEKEEGAALPIDYLDTMKKNDIGNLMKDSMIAKVFFWVVFAFLFIYLHFEFYYFFDTYYPPIRMTVLSYIWLGGIIYIFSNYLNAGRKTMGILCSIFILLFICKLLFVDLSFWKFSFDGFIYAGSYSLEAGIMRLLDFIPAIIFFGYACFLLLPKTGEDESNQLAGYQMFGTISLSLLFFYTTFELNTFLADKAPGFQAGGISILWSLFAIAFVLTGILKDSKALRYSGLFLFLVVVVKVFFVDLRSLDQLYRIIAFVVLGLIILAGAFVYVRFKDFFATEEVKEEKNDKP